MDTTTEIRPRVTGLSHDREVVGQARIGAGMRATTRGPRGSPLGDDAALELLAALKQRQVQLPVVLGPAGAASAGGA
jgi:hypothetical protein